jgi:glycosyltransferase involved in cell wall biosynthesis
MDIREINICFVAHTFYDRDGRVRRHAETLADICRQVDVIALRAKGQPASRFFNGVRIFTIPFGHRSKMRSGYLLEYGISFILFSFWLLSLYIKHRYHIIHIHNMPDFLTFTAFLPRILGAKVILDIHDPMPELYLSKFEDSTKGLGTKLMRFQEKTSTSFANIVITANHLFKENLKKRGIPKDKIIVIKNVAEGKIFKRTKIPRVQDGCKSVFTLMYVGTVARRYGLDIPIRALPKLIHHIPHIRLEITGALRDGAEELLGLVDQLGVSSYVNFIPPIPIDEIPGKLAAADIGIYTAHTDPHMNIASPTKVFEYIAMGLPTIASRLPILEELFSEGSLQFFEPGNVEHFAQCVIDLYDHPEKRQKLVKNADKDFPQEIAWQQERDTYLRLLGQLLKSKMDIRQTDEVPEKDVA